MQEYLCRDLIRLVREYVSNPKEYFNDVIDELKMSVYIYEDVSRNYLEYRCKVFNQWFITAENISMHVKNVSVLKHSIHRVNMLNIQRREKKRKKINTNKEIQRRRKIINTKCSCGIYVNQNIILSYSI